MGNASSPTVQTLSEVETRLYARLMTKDEVPVVTLWADATGGSWGGQPYYILYRQLKPHIDRMNQKLECRRLRVAQGVKRTHFRLVTTP